MCSNKWPVYSHLAIVIAYSLERLLLYGVLGSKNLTLLWSTLRRRIYFVVLMRISASDVGCLPLRTFAECPFVCPPPSHLPCTWTTPFTWFTCVHHDMCFQKKNMYDMA